MTTHTWQASCAQALLDPQAAPPAGLRTWNGSDPAQRWAVYRNNVLSSLVCALGDTFDVVRQLTGQAFFDTLATRFARAHPPCSPILATYGRDLPAFIAQYGPAASLPYLADVARLEYARVQAFHAADAPGLSADALRARLAQPQTLPQSRLLLHPSVHVIVSAHAVASLWAAHQGLIELADVDADRAEGALVMRADDDAQVIGLSPAAARLIQALQAGATLGEALDTTMQGPDAHSLDLPGTWALLIHHSLITAWLAPGEPS